MTVFPVPIIAIDGPSGAGKGTLCQRIAGITGFALLDSGALYRLTALAAESDGVDLRDEDAVAAVARTLDIAFDVVSDTSITRLRGRDVTRAIRAEQIGMNASLVAAYPKVRQALLERQRAFARPPGLVADGRDMGTVVFPDATLKIFLTASAQERARRRVLQLRQSGNSVDESAVLADIEARDRRDAGRSTAPLVPAGDARVLDTTHLDADAVLQCALDWIRERLQSASENAGVFENETPVDNSGVSKPQVR